MLCRKGGSVPLPKRDLCVVGLGYIGLPTAALFAARGTDVHGVDVDANVLERVAGGETPNGEPGLAEVLRKALASGRLTLGASPVPANHHIITVGTPANKDLGASPVPANHHIITVGTPANKDGSADLSALEMAVSSVLPLLTPGDLVVLESTVPPGTTERCLLKPLREARSSPAVGVAYCAERVLPGRLVEEFVALPRTIGAADVRSAAAAEKLYARVVSGSLHHTDIRTAEMVKVMENTFRAVNIALANEIARACAAMGIDAWAALSLANRHPRVSFLRPGPGVGGHCVGVDPRFLAHLLPEETPLVQAALRVNDSMPEYLASSVWQLTTGAHPRIGLLGLTFKEDVADARESPALRVLDALEAKGAVVSAHDPLVPEHPRNDTLENALEGVDCVVHIVAHKAFRALEPAKLRPLVRRKLVVDATGRLRPEKWERAGFSVYVMAGRTPEGLLARQEAAATSDAAGAE